MKTRLVFLSLAVLLTLTVAAQIDRTTPQPAPAITVVELGRLLFWDPILSGEKDIACATCHHPDFAYADGRELSLGPGSVGLGPSRVDLTDGRVPVVKRNSPTVLNTVFNGVGRRRRGRRSNDTSASADQARAPMFWDRRARSLETQSLEPIKNLKVGTRKIRQTLLVEWRGRKRHELGEVRHQAEFERQRIRAAPYREIPRSRRSKHQVAMAKRDFGTKHRE